MLDVPDAYPPDDAELDAMHPETPADEQTADWVRQRDYEDLVKELRACDLDDFLTHGARGLPYAAYCFLLEYAHKYGDKQALHVVYGVLPSQGAKAPLAEPVSA